MDAQGGSKYYTNVQPYLEQIKEKIGNGELEKDIYTELKISHDSWYKYKREKPEFAEALKKSYDIQLERVENSLFKECVGYDYTEKETKIDINNKKSTKFTTKRHIPNITAIIFYLKCRAKLKWNDGSNQPQYSFDIPPEMLKKLSSQDLQQLKKVIAKLMEPTDDETSNS